VAKRLKGMPDVYYPDIEYYKLIEKESGRIFEDYGFSEIRTPVLEETAVFKRSVGEETDIVSKEMYSFEDRDKKKTSICLRPENTASVVRAYLENRLGDQKAQQKLYYIGPMFRRERPQKGRQRQFFQVGAEIFGAKDPSTDVELLKMLEHLFKTLGLTGLYTEINSIGCKACRPEYRSKLISYLNNEDELCGDCKIRRDKNPLRVLDCKNENCKKIVENAPVPFDFLCEDCGTHYSKLKEYLKVSNISFVENKLLVRGLDYYTKTVFEIKSNDLGAQNTLCAGGRYDDLVKTFGGPETPAVGFSLGVERLVIVLKEKELFKVDEIKPTDIFVAALGDEAKAKMLPEIFEMRNSGISVEMDFSKDNLKKLMKSADKLKSKYAFIIGEAELSEGKGILRNMESKEQREIELDSVLEEIKTYL
jgi:histidyl-tRNA synthetase